RESAGRAIVTERARRPFRDPDDLVRRCGLGKVEVETLAEIGALAPFRLTRRAALWEGARVIRPAGALFEGGAEAPDPSPLPEMTTGTANATVRPTPSGHHRLALVSEPFLLIDGTLQQQDGVVSVRAERVEPLPPLTHAVPSHDFG